MKTLKIQIGIKTEDTVKVADSLNILLADEHILYIKTRNAHWNVEGPDFMSQHKFFEEQYKQLEEIIDSVAERIRSIGHYADASLQAFLKLTHLSEETREKNDSTGFIKDLLKDHESIITFLRQNINSFADKWHDQGSSDFITGLMEAHGKIRMDAKITSHAGLLAEYRYLSLERKATYVYFAFFVFYLINCNE